MRVKISITADTEPDQEAYEGGPGENGGVDIPDDLSYEKDGLDDISDSNNGLDDLGVLDNLDALNRLEGLAGSDAPVGADCSLRAQ